MKTVNELIKDINSLTSHLHEKDFLLTWEQTPDELKQVLDVAAALKALRAENISTKVFNSGLGISVFRDNSTRTRFSYASALNLLGLAQQDSATIPPVPASLMLPRLTCSALHNKILTKVNHKSLTAKPCVKPPI